MKRIVKIAALALAVMSLTVACKHGDTEVNTDSVPPADTLVIEEEVTDSIVEEEPVAEPAKPAAKPAAKKQTQQPQQAQQATVQTVNVQGKPSATSVAGQLKQGEGNSTTATATTSPTGKPSAANAFKKN